MTTKFGIGILFRKAQVSAKFNCPTSTVTLFSEYGERRICSSPVIQSQKRAAANSGGTIVYNYPCSVRRRSWIPRGLLLCNVTKTAKRLYQPLLGLIWYHDLEFMINFLLASIQIKEQAFNYADNFGAQRKMRVWWPKRSRVDFQMNLTEVDPGAWSVVILFYWFYNNLSFVDIIIIIIYYLLLFL